jgi:hypothetical protein
MESIHVILKGANDRKLESVFNFAQEYAFENWNTVVANPDGVGILGLDLFQTVSASFSRTDTVKTLSPEGPQPENSIMADYKRLFEEMPLPDLTIEVGGEKVPCHRAVLAMYSDKLAQRFRTTLKPGVNASIKMIDDPQKPDVQSASAVVSMLRFIYYGENKMDPIDACEMIHKVNALYNLSTFEMLCEHTVVNNINARSVIPIVGITYIQGMDGKDHIKALRKHALAFVIANFATIDLSALANMPPEIRTDLLLTLQEAYKSGKLGGGPQGKEEEEPVIGIDDDDL